MKFAVTFLFTIIVAISMADTATVKYDKEGYPELTQLSEEGFIDMVFRISDTHVDKNGWYTLTAEAKHRGTLVGLQIAVQPGMRPGIVNDDIDKTAFYSKGILLIRDGANSDALLRTFEELYKSPVRDLKFREKSETTSIALMGDPRKLQTEYLKFKIFHDDQDERGEYFELFLHINIKGGIIVLNEKDQEYRPTILKGLAQPKP